MPMLDTATGPVFYDERGAADGAPIVLLPSGGHDHHHHDELRHRLALASFRTVALDWPAHGASPAPSEPASATLFADVAEALVEHVVGESGHAGVGAAAGAVVVGNSVGGFSAARLAIRRPDLVAGLVLIDS